MSVINNSSEISLKISDFAASYIAQNETGVRESLANENLNGKNLIIRGLSKSFTVASGKVQALKEVDLIIYNGELVSLVGPSGCGKTTLLNIIAGLEQPDSGVIISNQEYEKNLNQQRGRLMIFQEASLFPWLSVFENVAYGLKLRKLQRKDYQDLVIRYLDLVELSRFKDAYIHQLSGGMKQRVALARALVLEPEMLLMDEPFAALDIQTRQDMYHLLLEIWQKTNKTILFITHNVEEALVLSNRILVMTPHPGEIKKEFRIRQEYPRNLESDDLRIIRAEITREFGTKAGKAVAQGGAIINA